MESRNEPTCRAAVETDMENRLVDMEGKERVARTERVVCEMCEIDSQWGFAV